MLGAIIGDVVGSRFEWHNVKSKEFEFFTEDCFSTDDTNMSLAVALAILNSGGDRASLPAHAVRSMRTMGRFYPGGFGRKFREWVRSEDPRPYGSLGNGAGMRVSPCAWAAESLEEALELSDAVTAVTHNHPEGLKGARAITASVFLARKGCGMDEIREHVEREYYPLNFTLETICPYYGFDMTCAGSVPQAIEAFLESDGFEDAVRNAVSIGGDSDTIAAMTGAIAEAYWGIPDDVRTRVTAYLDEVQTGILNAFEERYGHK